MKCFVKDLTQEVQMHHKGANTNLCCSLIPFPLQVASASLNSPAKRELEFRSYVVASCSLPGMPDLDYNK